MMTNLRFPPPPSLTSFWIFENFQASVLPSQVAFSLLNLLVFPFPSQLLVRNHSFRVQLCVSVIKYFIIKEKVSLQLPYRPFQLRVDDLVPSSRELRLLQNPTTWWYACNLTDSFRCLSAKGEKRARIFKSIRKSFSSFIYYLSACENFLAVCGKATIFFYRKNSKNLSTIKPKFSK